MASNCYAVNCEKSSNSKEWFDSCIDCKRPKDNIEWKYCEGKATENSEIELVSVCKKIYPYLNNEGLTQLKESQENWLKYRNSHCGFRNLINAGGSGLVGFIKRCETELTKERINDLERLMPFDLTISGSEGVGNPPSNFNCFMP